MCTHPIDPMGIHLLRCTHSNECIETHDVIHDTFVAIVWNVGSMWDDNNYMHFFPPCSIPFVDKSTLCSLKMKFALINVVIANPTQTYFFPDLVQPKDLLLSMQLKPKIRTIMTNTPLINSSF
jgi:hypothetical protein